MACLLSFRSPLCRYIVAHYLMWALDFSSRDGLSLSASPNRLSDPIRPIADQMAHVRRVAALACLVAGRVKIFFVFAQALHGQFI
jgi:hypothetical protein